jgi:hypothetical protein
MNFLNSISFSTIFSAPDVPMGDVQVQLLQIQYLLHLRGSNIMEPFQCILAHWGFFNGINFSCSKSNINFDFAKIYILPTYMFLFPNITPHPFYLD